MKRNGCGVRARTRNQLPLLQMCQCALDRAAGKSRGSGDRLMRQADRPIAVVRCLTIEVQVNDERHRPAVVADQVGQETIEHIGIECNVGHEVLWY